MRRVLSQLADGRLLALVVLSVVVAAFASVIVSRRTRRPLARVLPVLAVTFPIFAVTLFDRQGTVRDASILDGLTWWLDDWDEVPDLARGDAGWRLNVVLFVPAGAAWTWLVRRPGAVLLGLASTSFLIETTQAVTYMGAPDPGDFVANTLGAAIGVFPVASWARLRRPDESRQVDRRMLAAATVGLVLVVAVGIGFVQTRANATLTELRAELDTAFVDTKVDEIDAMFVAYEQGGINRFETLVSVRPDWWVHGGDGVPMTARYATEFFGAHRCVLVTFSQNPPVIRNEKGSYCTRWLGDDTVPR